MNSKKSKNLLMCVEEIFHLLKFSSRTFPLESASPIVLSPGPCQISSLMGQGLGLLPWLTIFKQLGQRVYSFCFFARSQMSVLAGCRKPVLPPQVWVPCLEPACERNPGPQNRSPLYSGPSSFQGAHLAEPKLHGRVALALPELCLSCWLHKASWGDWLSTLFLVFVKISREMWQIE